MDVSPNRGDHSGAEEFPVQLVEIGTPMEYFRQARPTAIEHDADACRPQMDDPESRAVHRVSFHRPPQR
jgi:hypothetical protein